MALGIRDPAVATAALGALPLRVSTPRPRAALKMTLWEETLTPE